MPKATKPKKTEEKPFICFTGRTMPEEIAHQEALWEQHIQAKQSSFYKDARYLPLDPIDGVSITDLLSLERRAAMAEKRDPNSITEENVREIAKARRAGGGVLKGTTTAGKKALPLAAVKNDAGIQVEQSAGGRYLIYGFPHTKIFMWMGGAGWSLENVKTALASIGMPEISEASIKTFLRAGAKGGDCDGRGEAAKLTEAQGAALSKAAGLVS